MVTTNWEERLGRFLELNSEARVESWGDGVRISRPWRDDTVALQATPPGADRLADALNNVVLPSRFSAIYHVDQERLEFIYTYAPPDFPLIGRAFTFALDGHEFRCEFSTSSDRLLTIADCFQPAGAPYRTNFRNLLFLTKPPAEPDVPEAARFVPVSFWLHPMTQLDEDEWTRLAKHLNFCMKYYDRHSSTILVHTSAAEDVEYEHLVMLKPEFPSEIRVCQMDPFLLDLAAAAQEASEARAKFIYYYQILEHGAFYAVDDKTRRQLLRVIQAPDIQANAEEYLPKILDAVADVRMGEEQKLAAVIAGRVSADDIWREVEVNRDYFTCRHEFDGGFALDAIFAGDTTLETFKAMWLPKMADTLRHIRNALVHAREARTGAVIAPTRRNDDLLRPWLVVIQRIAEQVMLYE